MRNKVLPIYRVCIAIANESDKKRIDRAQTNRGRIITRQTVARTLARLVEEQSLVRFDSQSCGLVIEEEGIGEDVVVDVVVDDNNDDDDEEEDDDEEVEVFVVLREFFSKETVFEEAS